jgi:hypothetical protein
MKSKLEWEPKRLGRRRFLGFLGGVGAAGLPLPLLHRQWMAVERSLKEADFYRPHDLAG